MDTTTTTTTAPIPDGNTALHKILQTDESYNLKAAKELLRNGQVDTLATNDRGETPLQAALDLARSEIAHALVQHSELLRALAVYLGRELTRDDVPGLLCGKTLRKFRKDTRRRVDYHFGLLIDAARTGDLATVRSMVDNGIVTVNAVDKSTGETPFAAALAHSQWHVCAFLMDHTDAFLYSPCLVDGKRQSVLLTAVLADNVDFVRRLDPQSALECGTHFDGDVGGALIQAIASGSTAMVDTLLAMGARPDPYTSYYNVPHPVSYALRFDHRDLTPAEEETQTLYWVLARACWHQDTRLIAHLLATYDVFQDRESFSTSGAAALFLAVYHEDEPLARELLARGVIVDTQIAEDMTAVVAAVLANSVRMLTLLLEQGADASVTHSAIVESTGNDESLLATALHVGAIDCAHALLPMETRPAERDLALVQALQREDQAFTELLLSDGTCISPSTQNALGICAQKTTCPIMLDLLLSRTCSEERFPISVLNETFCRACGERDASFVAVYLAHGIRAEVNRASETESPLLTALLTNDHANGLKVATLLAANGVLFGSWNDYGGTYLREIERRLANMTIPSTRMSLLEASRDCLLELIAVACT